MSLTLLLVGGASQHDLTADNLSAGAPTLGSPSVGQAHVLAATGVTAGAVTTGTPAIGQAHVLAAVGIAAGAPSLDSPDIAQIHVFSCDGLDAGAPALGTPVLVVQGAARNLVGIVNRHSRSKFKSSIKKAAKVSRGTQKKLRRLEKQIAIEPTEGILARYKELSDRAAQQKETVYRLELEYSQLWFDDDDEDIEVLLVS